MMSGVSESVQNVWEEVKGKLYTDLILHGYVNFVRSH